MPELLRLADDRHRVTILPGQGGGIAGFDALTAGGAVPVYRPRLTEGGAFGLASNLLVPFSNRISGGGFAHGGSFHAVAPNRAGEPFPLHGDGWQRAWAIETATADRAVLRLDAGEIGPFRYSAEAIYHLDGDGLVATLDITNTGPDLPFGGGFHPWLPRFADTTLQFDATAVWLEDARHLPTEQLPLAAAPDWRFAAARSLPPNLINNAFTGWSGRAQVRQPTLGIAIAFVAESPLDVAIVYSPGADADFFCFEPVSHAVDAHNQPGQPGLKVLRAGESLRLAMRTRWTPLAVGGGQP